MKKIYFFSQLFKVLSHRLLKRFGYLPRGIVFAIDILLLVVSCFITGYILFSLSPDFDIQTFTSKSLVAISVSSIYFLLFRTYSGLIRHSTILDAVRLLFCTSAVAITLLTINSIQYYFLGFSLFKTTTILIFFIISFTTLFFFRIFVKQIYEYIYTYNNKYVTRLAVLGTNDSSVSIGTALFGEKPKRFNVVAFLDTKRKNQSKRILGLPILYLQEEDVAILIKKRIQAILIPSNVTLEIDRKKFLNLCVEKGIKIYVAPLLKNLKNDAPLSSQIKNIQIEDLLERKPIELDKKAIKKQIRNKVILVSGAAGSIGSEISHQLVSFKPYELILLDQAESPMFELGNKIKETFPSVKIRCIIADIRNYKRLHEIFEQYQPDIVYHAAAYKHVPLMELNPYEALLTNVFGTKNLADLSVKFMVERFVMVSTDKAVNPSNVMGASKRIAEIYVQSLNSVSHDHHTKFITTRFGNVLGSNGSVVPIFQKQIEKGGPVTITHPDIIRYFMTIPEACQLVLEAGSMGGGGEIFIFDMGEPVKIIDLATKMIKLSGLEPHTEIKISITGLRPGEKLYEELLNNQSTTHPTYNEKIMIATEHPYEYSWVVRQIDELQEVVMNHSDFTQMVQKMKEIVPEFISQNSVYQSLDFKNEVLN